MDPEAMLASFTFNIPNPVALRTRVASEYQFNLRVFPQNNVTTLVMDVFVQYPSWTPIELLAFTGHSSVVNGNPVNPWSPAATEFGVSLDTFIQGERQIVKCET